MLYKMYIYINVKVTLRLREEEDLRCCLRVVFVPVDLNVLLAQDPEAFNYLYTQVNFVQPNLEV